jgi:large subunit ribosomal protein L22
MAGTKTNEREGTRAVLRYARVSPYKAREVLDLIRNKPVGEADDILRFSERDVAILIGKLLRSAVANAENNDQLDPEDLFVAACFADEGTTIKRWRPRARGRATRIRKRTCHITIIVSRLPEEKLARLRSQRQAERGARRARRVAGARRTEGSRATRRGTAPAETTAVDPEVLEAEGAEIEEQEDRLDETAAVEAEATEEADAETAAVADAETPPVVEASDIDDEPQSEAAVDEISPDAEVDSPSPVDDQANEEKDS